MLMEGFSLAVVTRHRLLTFLFFLLLHKIKRALKDCKGVLSSGSLSCFVDTPSLPVCYITVRMSGNIAAAAKDVEKPKSKAHVPQVDRNYKNWYNGAHWNVSSGLYDLVMFLFDILFTIFFREIKIRGASNMPQEGVPTILVCAPHANQFVDPTLVMVQTRKLTRGRARQACFVTAESSLKMKMVGFFGGLIGSIPVPRAQDSLKPVDENVEIYVADFDNDPLTIKGRCRDGSSPEFTKRFGAKSLLGLPDYLANAQIKQIVDDETIILASPFKSKNPRVQKLLTEGTNFKYAPHVDNSKVFQNVFNHLHTNGTVGIFPEGGSHDRPSLLPIKAGVVIMALGAAAADPNMRVNVVPVGLHYFHRNKFRSRAVIEYGEPIIVDGTMGQEYLNNPRESVSKLLNVVSDSLFSVTENAPDYDTLMTIQAARRLFQSYETPEHRFSLPLVVEINRRLLVGYSKYKEDPRIVNLKQMVSYYNSMLNSYGLKDHQVEKLVSSSVREYFVTFSQLLERLFRLLFFFLLSLPGSILFTPIFIICDVYSKKKQREGLKKSVVKIKGLDLLATWKLIVALVLAPLFYVTYSLIFLYLFKNNAWVQAHIWVPFPQNRVLLYLYFYSLLVLTTYASFKTGEIGMDLFKSLPPLVVSLVYPNDKIVRIKELRRELSLEITNICNELGPTVFEDYEKFKETHGVLNIDTESMKVYANRSRSASVTSLGSTVSNALSRVNSRGSLSDMPIFSEPKVSSSSSSAVSSDYTESEHEKDDENESDSDSFMSDNDDEKSPLYRRRRKNKYQSKITTLVREKWESDSGKQ